MYSSHLLLSASMQVPGTYFIGRVLSAVSFVPYPISEFFRFYSFSIFFRRPYFSGGVFLFCCALVPGRLALDLPTLILQRRLFFLCLTVTTEFVYLQDEESGRTLGVLLISLGRNNGLMCRQQQ